MLKTTLTLLTILCTISLFSQNNAQWRGDNRDGIYKETGLLKEWPKEGPKLLWHFDDLGPGHASASVTDELVLTAGTTGEEGFIIAFDYTGKQVWKAIYGKEWVESYEGVRSTPTIYNGKVYILSAYGRIVCINLEDGKILWTVDLVEEYTARNIKWGFTENLVVDGEMLFITAGGIDANVIALNKDTGKLIWKCKGAGEKSAYCSPALIQHNSKKVFVTQTESFILGVDAANGTLLWKYSFPNKYYVHANTALYKDGQLFCMSGYGKGGIMLKISDDGSSVSKVWENTEVDNRMGGYVLIDGRIYGGGDFSRKWFCLDWKTGKELYNSSDMKSGNLIYADGLMYFYGTSGDVALVKAGENAFNYISTFEVPYGEKQHWAHMVIHNKRLYVRHGESLMVYDISAK